jgi:hypothetical protein
MSFFFAIISTLVLERVYLYSCRKKNVLASCSWVFNLLQCAQISSEIRIQVLNLRQSRAKMVFFLVVASCTWSLFICQKFFLTICSLILKGKFFSLVGIWCSIIYVSLVVLNRIARIDIFAVNNLYLFVWAVFKSFKALFRFSLPIEMHLFWY